VNGSAAVRDGAYLLPAGADGEEVLRGLAVECEAEGGSAWVMSVQARSEDEELAFRSLFNRAEDYAALEKSWT